MGWNWGPDDTLQSPSDTIPGVPEPHDFERAQRYSGVRSTFYLHRSAGALRMTFS